MVYKAVSVHIKIVSFALIAPIILVPSCNLCVPAALTAEGAKVLMSSWSPNLINISSCVVVVPIVVSVPKCIKCLVVGDINVALDAVGLLEVEKLDVLVDALLDVAFVAPAFHVKVLPFATVATNT